MIKLGFIFIITISFFLLSCSTCNSQKEKISISKPTLQMIVKEKLGKRHSIVKNTSESHALCIKSVDHKKSSTINHVNFIIVDLSDNSIIFEDSYVNGSVSWENDYIIIAKRIPGMIAKPPNDKNSTTKYRFDVKRRKKI